MFAQVLRRVDKNLSWKNRAVYEYVIFLYFLLKRNVIKIIDKNYGSLFDNIYSF